MFYIKYLPYYRYLVFLACGLAYVMVLGKILIMTTGLSCFLRGIRVSPLSPHSILIS